MRRWTLALVTLAAAAAPVGADETGEVLPPARDRYAAATDETPDFQRHVLPLMGRLGCNGRACHGSFQGAGGFRLSLFGYDFNTDHQALLEKDQGRVDTEAPELSLILQKPTLTIPHKGGRRMEVDLWAYRLFARWVEAGAPPADGANQFDRLEITPSEIRFDGDGQTTPLRVIAHWKDGSREDVTCLSRFRTNDEAVAEVNEEGVVATRGAGDTHIVAFYDNGVAAVPVLRPVSDRIGPDYPETPAPTEIDRLVVAKLRKLGIVPSAVCTDAEFLRRAAIDLTGSLPMPEEVQAFLADPSPEKRARKIDELMERPAYAAYWSNRLCELTGDTSRAFVNTPGGDMMARHWYAWIERRLAENRPYDELVAGIVLATSRQDDQSFEDYLEEESSYYREDDPADFTDRPTMPYYWARRTVRSPEDKALHFSYAFLGVRLECAQCHKHPFDQWTQTDFKDFTAFFRRINYGNAPGTKEIARSIEKKLDLGDKKGNQLQRELAKLVREGEVVPWLEVFITAPKRRPPAGKDQNKPAGDANLGPTPRVLGGASGAQADADDDPRAPLMEWMRRPDNPYFARAFVNRVWTNHFGRGLIDPPDDLSLANPPSNAALLDYLTESFVRGGFDIKALHRLILLSDTYQRSWRPNDTNGHDQRNFSRALVRRLPAEVLLDAVAQASAADAALPAFATNMESRAIGPIQGAGAGRRADEYAGRVFGRSNRDTNCDCSRSDEPNLLQAVYLQNDGQMLTALDRDNGWIHEQAERLGESSPPPEARRQLIERAYLRTLNRLPNASEEAAALAYFEAEPSADAGLRGILWALLNTKEFITNH